MLPESVNDRHKQSYRESGADQTKQAVIIEQDESSPAFTTSASYKTIIDEVSKNLSYVGDAQPGSLTSVEVWRIKRIQTVGNITTVSLADGNSNFDNIWDNRLSLTYS